MKQAYVFPGQGSQSVGMGRSFAELSPIARETFEQADEALGFSLSKLCWEGPEEELQLTANTQPAILAASVAIYRHVAQEGGPVAAVAGHSLGEYSALVAAGSVELQDALRLVRRRGQIMQEAVPVGEGGMAAVLGLETEVVHEVCEEAACATGGICAVANLNAPGQIVIAGHRGAVDRAAEVAKKRGARRSMLLPVSAPFHSPLMASAREAMKPLLEATEFRDPQMPVITNVDARPLYEGAAVRGALVRQIDSPVRWIESVRCMVDELAVERFVELGPGTVLAGLIRRIERRVRTVSIGEPAALAKLSPRASAGAPTL